MKSNATGSDDIQLCTFISPNVNPDPSGLTVYTRKNKKSIRIPKSCCTVCAFKEEQLFQKQHLKDKNISLKCIQLLVDICISRCLSPKGSNRRQPLYDFSKKLSYSSVHSIFVGFLLFGTKVFAKELSEDRLYSKDGQSMSIHLVVILCAAASMVITVAFKNRTMNTNNIRRAETEERSLLQSNNYHSQGYDNEEVQKRQDRYAQILSRSIKCKTISYDVEDDDDDNSLRKGCYNELKKLHAVLRESFPILYQRHPPSIIAGYSLLFTIPGSNADAKPIMLCSHLDVVPAPNSEDEDGKRPWVHDPFGGIIEDGVIWGRGAIDNKHNLIAQLAAMEEILSLKQYPERTICIAIGHDEEVGGFDGASSISNVLKKRDMKFDFILDEGTMMISGVIPGTKGAIGLIGTVEKGNITVELSVTGSGGHSSAPPINSESIMQVISKAVIAVESNPLPAHFERGSAFRSTMEHLAPKVTFPWNLIYSNFWIFGPLFKQLLKRASNGAAACIRTTTAVTKMSGGTKINVLPFEAKAYINHRVHPGDSFESVLNHDRRMINDKRVTVRIMNPSTLPSPASDVSSYSFGIIQETIQEVFGNLSAPALVVGNTDTRWYWDLSTQIYRFSPVALSLEETTMFHGLNERISKKSLVSMVDFYKLLITKTSSINTEAQNTLV